MKKIDLEIKANTLVDKRNSLTAEISRYWKIIENENVIKKGMKRNYDLKAILVLLEGLYNKLTIIKLRLQCLNMGIKFKDLDKNANIINIYKLSAFNEYYVKIDELIRKHTISVKLKMRKGKKNLSYTEELTSSYLDNIKKEYSLKCNKLRKAIEDFNNNTEADNEIPEFLAA